LVGHDADHDEERVARQEGEEQAGFDENDEGEGHEGRHRVAGLLERVRQGLHGEEVPADFPHLGKQIIHRAIVLLCTRFPDYPRPLAYRLRGKPQEQLRAGGLCLRLNEYLRSSYLAGADACLARLPRPRSWRSRSKPSWPTSSTSCPTRAPSSARPSPPSSAWRARSATARAWCRGGRSEEHTSELQTLTNLVIRLLLTTM